MKELCKAAGFVMVLVLCFSNTVYAQSSDSIDMDKTVNIASLTDGIDYEMEFKRAQSNISDVPITEEMLENCEAAVTDESGKIEEADLWMTVRSLGNVSRLDGETATAYCLTAFAAKAGQKTDSGQSGTVDHTYAYGSLVWIDHLGIGNELVSVSGGWSTSGKDTLKDRYVGYGVSFGSGDTYLEKKPSGNTFSYSSNGKMKALFVCLDTSFTVNGEGLSLRVVNKATT